ncbi:MAG TPA: EamA family transporter [Burkholderiales bacterium]|nr:EamA family transporter [Burkholderiales bacterium]
MQAKPLGRWIGVLLLLAIALFFGSNHISARVAFEHGTSVTAAVTLRSIFTALVVLALIRVQGVSLALPAGAGGRALLIGCVLAVQSFCLYSAVARIPVALALLAFNTFPLLLSLISWAAGGTAPSRRALVAMPLALVGLALALDVVGLGGSIAGRWAEIGVGVGFAIGAALSFALMLHLTVRWLNDVDGRVRTLLTMSVAALIIVVVGAASGNFELPQAPIGWLGLTLLCVFYSAAFTSLFIVLPRIDAVNNAMVLNSEPIMVLGLAWVVLDQAVAPRQILGVFVVVGAIVYLSSARR